MANAPIARICECGNKFETTRSTKIFCSKDCQRKYSKASFEVVCEGCNVIFRPKRTSNKRFCSRVCGFEHQKRNAQSAEVLAAKLKARQVAAALKRVKVSYQPRACATCGSSFPPKQKNSRFCSSDCYYQFHLEQSRLRSEVRDRAKWVPITKQCRWCDCLFTPLYGNKLKHHCSDACASRYFKASTPKNIRKRMRVVGGEYEPINIIKLFERDQWRCQICGCKTPRALRGTYNDRAPEADHRVPISKGGGHTWANVQLACRRCNGLKSNKTSIGQLPLFIS